MFHSPGFLPFFQEAERTGALVFLHQFGETIAARHNPRYRLPSTVGNLVERSIGFATLVLGGVMDKFPGLKVYLGHGGGYVSYGVGRMDRGWEARPEARVNTKQPPSTYLRRFYYDCDTQSEAALRFLIDTVGADRVMFGTDFPSPWGPSEFPVQWLNSMASVTPEEKELIFHKNVERLLGL